MYNAHFGFSESPFENNLDQRFLFQSKDHREVLAALLHFAETKKGVAIVCGDGGTGKSMLINSFLDRLPESIQPITMPNPYISPLGILIHLAKALRIRFTKNENVLQITDKVKKALISAKLREKSFVLIIDEAHLLSNQALEEIRLLSNIETPDQKLLQILLVGQSELSYKLGRPEMNHLHWRINVNRILSPLNPEETSQYVDHRLKQAGSSLAAVLEDKCRSSIFKMTGGSPPRINQLFDNALLICMNEGLRKINRKVLQKAHEAWQTDLIFTPKSSKARTYRINIPNRALMVSACSVVVVVLLGIIATRSGLGVDNFQSVLQQVRTAIQTASGPQAPSVAKSEDLMKTEKKSARLKQFGKPEGVSASSLEISASAPILSFLPEGSGRAENKSKLSSFQKESSSPSGTSARNPEASGEPKAAETTAQKEDLRTPQEALKEMVGGAAGPFPRPPAQVASVSPQQITQAGDSLSRIANRNYPNNKKLGLAALILANPEIIDRNKILPGQTFYVPEINSDKETIRLKDQQFYASYGRYVNAGSLKKDTSWLQQKKVNFVLRNTQESGRNVVYRVFIGGYGTEAELEKALEGVNLKAAKGHKGVGPANQSVGSVKSPAKVADEAITDKQEALGNPKVTDMSLYKGMGNDPAIPKFNDRPEVFFKKYEVVGPAYQATFHKNRNNIIISGPKIALTDLSEVELEQVHVNSYVDLYKVKSNSKLDNSFNGFTGLGRINQSTGSINNQTNIVSFEGIK